MSVGLRAGRSIPILAHKITVLPVWFFSAMLCFPFADSWLAVPMLLNVAIFAVTSATTATIPVMTSGLTAQQTRWSSVVFAARLLFPAIALVAVLKLALASQGLHPQPVGDLLTLAVMVITVLVVSWVSRGVILGGGFREAVAHVVPLVVIFVLAGVAHGLLWPGGLPVWILVGVPLGLLAQRGLLLLPERWWIRARKSAARTSSKPTRPTMVDMPTAVIGMPVFFSIAASFLAVGLENGVSRIAPLVGVMMWCVIAAVAFLGPSFVLRSMGLASAVGMTRVRWRRAVTTRYVFAMLLALGVSGTAAWVSETWWPLSATTWACTVASSAFLAASTSQKLDRSASLRTSVIGVVLMIGAIPAGSIWAVPLLGQPLNMAWCGTGFAVIFFLLFWAGSARVPVSTPRWVGGSS